MPVMRKRMRRIIGAALVVCGALFMWLAPDSAAGIVLLGAGIMLEIAGIAFEHADGL
jgi:hypothetical protein